MIELYETSTQSSRSLPFAPALPPSSSESRLGIRYLSCQIKSAIPVLLADLSAILITLSLLLLASSFGLVALTLPLGTLIAFLSAVVVFSFAILGLYPNLGLHPAVEFKRVFFPISVISICLLATVSQVTATVSFEILGIALIWCGLAILVPCCRSAFRKLATRFAPFWLQPIVILGGGPLGEAIYRSIKSDASCGFLPLGIIDDGQGQWSHDDFDPNLYIGTYQELNEILPKKNVYWAVVTDQSVFEPTSDELESRYVPVELPHRLYLAETASFIPTMWDKVVTINMVTYFKQTDRLLLPIPRLFKRILDLTICALFAILIVPVFAVCSIFVKLSSRGPVFFRSRRIGRGNRTFDMFKFRSMFTDSEHRLDQYLDDNPEMKEEWKTTQKIKKDPRVTWIGRIMRRTSVDELPQILDVVRGKMSLVGPRPMLVSEPDMYGERYPLYCRMRPGITGLWQVSGRNNTSHEQRVKLVTYYVQNWSPWLDLYILVKTFKVVATGEGAY